MFGRLSSLVGGSSGNQETHPDESKLSQTVGMLTEILHALRSHIPNGGESANAGERVLDGNKKSFVKVATEGVKNGEIPTFAQRSDRRQQGNRHYKLGSTIESRPQPKAPIFCYRCGEKGHFANSCRNPLVCFKCHKTGHRSFQCFAQAPKAVTERSDPVAEDQSMGATVKKFNRSPNAQEIEDSLRRKLVLSDSEGWGKDRLLDELRKLDPEAEWKLAELPSGQWLIDGPQWWRSKALRDRKVTLDGVDFQIEGWNPERDNGSRLKSVWVRVVGFPLKLWTKAEFEKLIEEFGVLLEIDQGTLSRSCLTEAKLRLGVCEFGQIPPFKNVLFKTAFGEWRWSKVRFLHERTGAHNSGGGKRKRVWVRKEEGESSEKFMDSHGNDEGEEHALDDEDDVMEEEAPEGVIGEGIYAEEVQIGSDPEQSEVHTEGIYAKEVQIGSDPEKSEIHADIESDSHQIGSDVDPQNGADDNPVVTSDHTANEALKQLIVFQPITAVTEEATDRDGADIQPKQCRYSLRLKLKDPEKPIQEKAMERIKERDLESFKSGKQHIFDKYPLLDFSDDEVASLFERYGILLSSNPTERIEHVQFLRSLTKKQFEHTVDEMEHKLQHGVRFSNKDKHKKSQLDKLLGGISLANSS